MTTPFIPDLAILDEPVAAAPLAAVAARPAVEVAAPASAIPTLWDDQHTALRVLQVAQWKAIEAASVAAGEPVDPAKILGAQPLIIARHFDALEAQPVSAAELAQLATAARGQYRAGDTRGYVRQQEEICGQFNCWMARDETGLMHYLSEHPDEIAKREKAQQA